MRIDAQHRGARSGAGNGPFQGAETKDDAMKIEYFDSVWDVIEPTPAEAANMKACSSLMMAIDQAVKDWHITQAAAAKRLGLTQPRLNDLLRGRINKFSLDALMTIATKAGLAVKVEVTRTAA